jgi:hypothetical protein
MSNLGIAGLIGVLVGVLGLAAAIFAVIWASGSIEYLGGKKKSPIAPLPAEKLKALILSINSPDLRYEIRNAPDADLLVEWKIADAKWFAAFAKEQIKETYRGYLLLDESRKSARYCEELVSIKWMARIDSHANPILSYNKDFFRGRILYQKTWGAQYGLREDLSAGKIYEYRFDVQKVRNPIKKIIEDNGWEFVPVIRKSHATRNLCI